MAERSSSGAHDRDALAEAAQSFCYGLARSLGPHFRVSLYRRRPPELIEAWGGPRRTRERDPVLTWLARSPGQTINEPAERGTRITILPLPMSNGDAGYAVAIEVDTGAMRRASRLLASLADPDGEDFPSGESEPHLGDALDRMIAAASAQVGVPTSEMSRSQKQQVVRYLDERGAFLIKKAVEQVAGELGVSRFTIYNYLEDTNRRDAGAGGAKHSRTASDEEGDRS